jgi:nitroreductase
MHAAAAAIYILLLAAHARGLAGYWRTPEVLRTEEGREAVGVPDDERILGLVYLGHPCQDKEPPARQPSADYVTYLA